MELLFCTSQQANEHPYRFPGTGIQVYSFEEVMYHVYHYWKQSVDDVTSPNLGAWVHDTLGLSRIAVKIKEITKIEPFSERMLAFLKIIPYFNNYEIEAIRPHFERWEKRLEWETYKERADDLVNRGEPGKAISLYRRALQYEENIPVLNNLSVAYMQLDNPDEACRCLKRALAISKSKENEKSNWELLLHYGEALIAAKHFEEALHTIELAAQTAPKSADPDILYLKGELAAMTGKSDEAISFLEQAIALSPEEQYVFRLSDVYATRRQFEKALEILAKSKQSLPCLMKTAELHNKADNLPAAISAIRKAIEIKSGFVELWVRLARYNRLNYDLVSAEEAITKAMSLDSGNERVRLELARIQKNMGQTRAYQQLLKGILSEFKGRYRDL